MKIISNDISLVKKTVKKSYNKSYSDSSKIFRELQKIKYNLLAEGYICASFDSVVFDSTDINAYLFIGKKYFVNQIIVEDTAHENKKRHEISSKGFKKNIFNTEVLLKMYYKTISEYENSGYPFAEIVPYDIDLNDSTVSLKIKINRGKLININELFIKGNSKISGKYMRRYLSLFKGDNYDESVISRINSKTGELSFISQIRKPEIDFYEDKADVYLYLNKRKANLFNGIIGFIPDKKNDDKLSFTGDIKINLLNNFNKGEKIGLHWTGAGNQSQKLDAGLYFPYMFNSPFGTAFNFKIDKKDTTYVSVYTKAGLDYSFKNNDKIFSYALWNNSFIISNSGIDTSIFKNSKSFSIGLGYFTENLDYKYNPSKGIVLSTDIAAGNRIAEEQENKFYNVNATFDSYIPIYKKIVLRIAAESKYLLSDYTLFENEMFKLGGFSSIRGFDEDVFISSGYTVISSEIRFLFERNSNVYVFADYARINVSEQNVNSLKFPFGFGVGTNFSTKAGIFSISYALGKLNDASVQLSNSKIHVGYVNRF
ncbi:MAG: hypothetical protein K8R54_07760 [Bacteroidales bacterium]|nr:hypothetical protein [Bacteroidales bacterium]